MGLWIAMETQSLVINKKRKKENKIMFPLARKVQKETSTKSAPLIMLFLLLSSSYSKPKHFCSMMMVRLQNLLTTTVLKQ
jgi:hypothetical protein